MQFAIRFEWVTVSCFGLSLLLNLLHGFFGVSLFRSLNRFTHWAISSNPLPKAMGATLAAHCCATEDEDGQAAMKGLKKDSQPPAAACCRLLPPVAACCRLLPPVAACCRLLPPVAALCHSEFWNLSAGCSLCFDPARWQAHGGTFAGQLVSSRRCQTCRPGAEAPAKKFTVTTGLRYSSRFATTTAHTQGIGQRGKKRAYLA